MRGLGEEKLNEVRAHRTLVEEPGPDVAASDAGKQLGAEVTMSPKWDDSVVLRST